MLLAKVDEPLVVAAEDRPRTGSSGTGSYETRQMRRKARRAEARAAKRLGMAIEAELAAELEEEAIELRILEACEQASEIAAAAEPEIAVTDVSTPPALPEPAMPEPTMPEPATVAVATPAEPETAPLPRSQALAKQPTGLVARLNAWFARLLPVRKPRSVQRVSPDALAEQMLALRGELAMVQGRLDRMIAAVSAA